MGQSLVRCGIKWRIRLVSFADGRDLVISPPLVADDGEEGPFRAMILLFVGSLRPARHFLMPSAFGQIRYLPIAPHDPTAPHPQHSHINNDGEGGIRTLMM